MINKNYAIIIVCFLAVLASVYSLRVSKLNSVTFSQLSNETIANYILVNTANTGYSITETRLEYSFSIPSVSYYQENNNVTVWLMNNTQTFGIPIFYITYCLEQTNYDYAYCRNLLLFNDQSFVVTINNESSTVFPILYQLNSAMSREYYNALYARDYTKQYLANVVLRQNINTFGNITIRN